MHIPETTCLNFAKFFCTMCNEVVMFKHARLRLNWWPLLSADADLSWVSVGRCIASCNDNSVIVDYNSVIVTNQDCITVSLCCQGNNIRGPAAESLGRMLRQNASLRWCSSINFAPGFI